MKRSKFLIVSMVLVLTSCVSWVFAKGPYNEMPAGKYTLDLTHASIVWKVSHFGLSNYVARFTDFDAIIEFNPNNIEKSKVTASINPMSVQTAYPNAEEKDFDNILATDKGWFNAKAFPRIEFQSTSINMLTDDTAKMSGNLVFLGVSKAVELDVTINGAMPSQPFSRKPTMGFSASTVIIRSDWGLDKYLPHIGDDVEVMIEGEFSKGPDD